jgi:hypothetical protein
VRPCPGSAASVGSRAEPPGRARPQGTIGAVIDPPQDAFGAALLDYLEGKQVPELVLEVDGSQSGPAMHPEWFF